MSSYFQVLHPVFTNEDPTFLFFVVVFFPLTFDLFYANFDLVTLVLFLFLCMLYIFFLWKLLESLFPLTFQNFTRLYLGLLLSHSSHVLLCVTPQTQPTRLPRPWDSPGKNTGVGCHFLLQCMKVKSEREVAQSCPTLCNPIINLDICHFLSVLF